MGVTKQTVDNHLAGVRDRLAAELNRQGCPCRVSATLHEYIDLDSEGPRGFVLAVLPEYRDDPGGFLGIRRTGRAKIDYQGFGRCHGTTLVEPDGGFDLPMLATTIIQEAAASKARMEAYLASKAEAKRQAEEIAGRLNTVYGETLGITWDVAQTRAGEWEPRFSILAADLTEAKAQVILTRITGK